MIFQILDQSDIIFRLAILKTHILNNISKYKTGVKGIVNVNTLKKYF